MTQPVPRILDSGRISVLLICLAAAGLALAAPLAPAQANPAPNPPAATNSAKPLVFDAISIKPNNRDTHLTSQVVNGEAVISSQSMFRNTPDGINYANVTAKALIATAYNIKGDQISGGPDWAGSAGFDIQAKVTSFDPPDSHQLTKDQRSQMLQSLLADRFKLTIHYETKEAPVYELTIAKGGPKLHEAKPGDTYPNGPKGPDGISHAGMIMFNGPGQFTAQAVPTSNLADFLAPTLHQQVIDKTGLTGNYDFTLQFTPDNIPADSPNAGGPSIFTAVQEQLGLKLESTRRPVKSIVIDHIEPPSEN
jgi:uncharacterized protein (TIGR03435 family)